MDIIARLDEARRRCNVLDHRFYQRWSAGELSADDLGCYAAEYRHAVIALAEASARAVAQAPPEHRPGLARHASEEERHVQLWEDFAQAVAGGRDRSEANARSDALRSACSDALPQSRECATTWTAGEDILESLALLYAIEASQPSISQAKLEGLATHYDIAADSPATAYFRLHAELDVEHAHEASKLIAELMPQSDDAAQAAEERMISRARAALEANWQLLDGVEEQLSS